MPLPTVADGEAGGHRLLRADALAPSATTRLMVGDHPICLVHM